MDRELPVIYVLDASVAVTGAFIAARNMARVLSEHAQVVLVLPQGSQIAAHELQYFSGVEYIPLVPLSKRLSALLRYVPALVAGAWWLHRRMQKADANYLVLNDFYLMHGAMLRLFGFRGRIVSWVRCEPRRFAGFLAPMMLQWMRRSADGVVAVSKHIAVLLPQGYADAVVYDAYVGDGQVTRALSATDKLFVYVGNYIPGKGQDMALASFAKVAAQDATVRLAFYGGDMGLQKNRDYRAALEATAKQYGLESRVTFGGFVKDTQAVLAGAYAALNFSVSESFSMTVLEASGAGLPVIATASGGPQEIVVDGETGYIIPVGDVAAAAERMLQLAHDPALAERMGQAGANRVRERFSLQQFAQRLRAVLNLA